VAQPDLLDSLLGESSSFDDLDVTRLRRRRSYKWSAYPADVLPAFVAEMDMPLAPAVTAALQEAVELGDCGYATQDPLPAVFASFASRRWSWSPDPGRMVLVPDVMDGVARALEILTAPGAAVVLTPPVYGPFRRTVERLGRHPLEAPMVCEPGGWRLDLAAVARALEAGARAILLCNPHNPTGSVPTVSELDALRELAARHGAGIVSDEVHGPLTLPGRRFTPLLSLGDLRGLTVTSASKAWNVAGLKCAVVVAGDAATAAELDRLPAGLRHPGHLGMLAATAAFRAAAEGDGWLDRVGEHLMRQHERASALLAAALPAVQVSPVEAGYLRWLDCRELGLGDSPAEAFLERGRVALAPGLEFGRQGAGFARLNIGTSGGLLLDAVRRMRTALKPV
jgi:cystathionine beta-lyase